MGARLFECAISDHTYHFIQFKLIQERRAANDFTLSFGHEPGSPYGFRLSDVRGILRQNVAKVLHANELISIE